MSDLLGDPVLRAVLRLSLASLFAGAAAHKLREPRAFVATLRNYRLLPDWLAAPSAVALLVAESGVAVSLLVTTSAGAGAATVLLALYSAAIAVNLARGRRDIDCGCLGPRRRQTLSEWLLLRNAVVGAAALLLLAAPAPRALSWVDVVSCAAALAAGALTWASANRLMQMWPRLRSLRWQE